MGIPTDFQSAYDAAMQASGGLKIYTQLTLSEKPHVMLTLNDHMIRELSVMGILQVMLLLGTDPRAA